MKEKQSTKWKQIQTILKLTNNSIFTTYRIQNQLHALPILYDIPMMFGLPENAFELKKKEGVISINMEANASLYLKVMGEAVEHIARKTNKKTKRERWAQFK